MTVIPLPFPVEVLDALPAAGDGLAERRRQAADALVNTPWPTAEAEEWRYSPIGKVDAAAFASVTEPGAAAENAAGADIEGSARLTVVDGFVTEATTAVDGIDIVAASAADLGPLPTTAFGLLAAALAPTPTVVRIRPGTVVAEPIVIVDQLATAGTATFPHVVIDAGADSEATVAVVRSSGAGEALTVPRIHVNAASAARITVVELQLLDQQVTALGRTTATVGSQATFGGWAGGLGGGYARHRLDCTLAGRGASITYGGVYYGSNHQALDYRVFVDHVERDTTSDLRFHGVVDDDAQAVYTGMIRIHPGARGSGATQTNRNITLSDRSWAESVPNLEIENNDVHCAHASTVGPVDEDQLFYLASRGVPDGVARRLIVAGFLEQLIATAPVTEVAGLARAEVVDRLDTQGGSV